MFDITTASFLSAIFLILVLAGSFSDKTNRSRTLSIFRLNVVVTVGGLLCDGIYTLTNGNPKLLPDTKMLVFLSFFLSDYMVMTYALYIQEMAERGQKRLNLPIRIVVILCLINSALCLGLEAAGKLLIEDGGYVESHPMSSILFYLPIVCIFLLMFFTISRSKSLGVYYTLALCSYYLIIAVNTVISYLIPSGYESGYVGPAISCMLIYVFIQSRIVTEANKRAETFNNLSLRDALTGLRNRRSFDVITQSLDPEKEVGIIYCDLNGLKAVNDNEGHAAGDRYICKMARMLEMNFPHDAVFRTGGDEFIVLVKLKHGDDFEKIVASFEHVLSQNDKMASCGHASGKAYQTEDLLHQSERRMYAQKNVYYETTGAERRVR